MRYGVCREVSLGSKVEGGALPLAQEGCSGLWSKFLSIYRLHDLGASIGFSEAQLLHLSTNLAVTMTGLRRGSERLNRLLSEIL